MSRFIPEKEQPTQPPPILINDLRIAGEKQNISAIGETEIALPELDRDRNQLQIDNVAPIRALDGTIIEPLGIPSLTFDEIDAIVAFLEALTDDRVVHQSAPFDHPQIFVPNGHPGSSSWTIDVNG